MLEQLFGSNTRLNLLRLLVKNPNKVYFIRELSRDLDVQVNAVRREINLLKDVNLVKEMEKPKDLDTSEPGVALRKYYGINKNSPVYEEMKDLILKEQVLDEQELVRELVEGAGEVSFLVVTGKFTGEEDTPTDMLMVGDVNSNFVSDKTDEYEEKFGSEVKYTIMDEDEFLERHHIMDKFLYNIFEADHVKVVNDLEI
ncbi:MAG: hypothetical protein ABEJ24_02075 [Candidatus Magasanikbacteria bacterium]